MTVHVKKVLDKKYATNPSDGKLLFKTLKAADSISELVVSFKGIELLSSAFLNECIGKLASQNPSIIDRVKFIYPNKKPIFQAKVHEVIENALLGDAYDSMINDARVSL